MTARFDKLRVAWATLAIACCLTAPLFSAAPATMPAQKTFALTWAADDAGQFRPRLVAAPDVVSDASAAVVVYILSARSDVAVRCSENYTQISRTPDAQLEALATITTPAGSVLEVIDTWSAGEILVTLRREIRVQHVAGNDRAFSSEVEFSAPRARNFAEADVFIPGLWYADASHTPKSGLITDVGQRDFILREDRMSAPLISVRDRDSGWTLTLEHREPDGATIAADDTLETLIDARLQFGALGVRRDDGVLRAVFRFPGSEGEQTGIHGYKPARRTVQRFHPLAMGAKQHYALTLRLATTSTFATQVRDAWLSDQRYPNANVVPFDAAAVYNASVHVLDHYAYDAGPVSGFPFGVNLPDGSVRDRSLQIGFIGQQASCAAYLIDEGLRSDRPELVAQGERIVDFWARESLSPVGVPRTWFDLDPTPGWRNYNTFLRIATDGASGMLRAWQIERAAGRDKPAWLAFCRAVGEWLLKIQNADGSFSREWNFKDGTPVSTSKTNTLHPVRLLVDLSCATGDAKYRKAALRAAEFDSKMNASGARYVGGTPDNPDVIDKEASWIAFDSYLAIYDVTLDPRWLEAAQRAALFTETWIYTWNVPLPADSTRISIPRVKTTAGVSLIATGHSGADIFLAYASLSYARLAIYTNEPHDFAVARLLQANTAQFVDVAGSLGYAQPGLCVEAFSLAVNRGSSVKLWLPWNTSAILEPMVRMREAFGVMDVNALMTMDPADRERKHLAWARTRGFTPR